MLIAESTSQEAQPLPAQGVTEDWEVGGPLLGKSYGALVSTGCSRVQSQMRIDPPTPHLWVTVLRRCRGWLECFQELISLPKHRFPSKESAILKWAALPFSREHVERCSLGTDNPYITEHRDGKSKTKPCFITALAQDFKVNKLPINMHLELWVLTPYKRKHIIVAHSCRGFESVAIVVGITAAGRQAMVREAKAESMHLDSQA